MRLIDADALKSKIISWLKPLEDEAKMVEADNITVSVIMEIEDAQTVDPVKHGRWVREKIENGRMGVSCSCCDFPIWTVGEFKDVQHDELDRFCPHCGAYMMEGENNADTE